MNKLNENLNFCNSYFHGFQDIIESKSAMQTIKGCGKILSGFTLIIPIIFGLGYFITQNQLNRLEKLCSRVTKNLNESPSKQPSQKELITFLSTRVLDKNQEKLYFDAAFKKLDAASQKMFFDSMSDKKALPEALKHIPQDVREVNIGLGQDPSKEMIDEAITQLHASRQLHTLTFDLSQTTYLTSGIKKLFATAIEVIHLESPFKNVHVDFDLKDDYAHLGDESRLNNALPASRIVHGIVYHLIKDSQLAKINLCFKSRDGTSSSLFINPSRLSKIPEEDLSNASRKDPLNSLIPSPNAKDIWLAYAGTDVYMPKE